MKTTKREIKNFSACDITYLGFDDIQRLRKEEKWFTEIAYSMGTYGCNGLVVMGNETKTLYKITERTSTLFQLL